MLRKGLVALMMGVICAGSAVAADSAARKPNPAPSGGLVGWLKSKTSGQHATTSRPTKQNGMRSTATNASSGVKHAVVQDAELQAVKVRQTSGSPQDHNEALRPSAVPEIPTEFELRPIPVEQAPVLPNISTVSGPQYFSATPAGSSNVIPVYPGASWQTYQAPMPIRTVSQGQYTYPASASTPVGPQRTGNGMMTPQPTGGYYPMSSQGQYPQTGAALYPAPVPGIPQQIGGAAVVNPAFHPHEMLYPHQYHAMYPPYYYKVNGGFAVTPFGVWSQEHWKLEGTKVDVKYKSHISPFTLFQPPYHR